jgi:hypothetical protein
MLSVRIRSEHRIQKNLYPTNPISRGPEQLATEICNREAIIHSRTMPSDPAETMRVPSGETERG